MNKTLLVPIIGSAEERPVALVNGDLVPGEIVYTLVFEIAGKAHQAKVSKETYEAYYQQLAES